jgi:hypothetical protein
VYDEVVKTGQESLANSIVLYQHSLEVIEKTMKNL